VMDQQSGANWTEERVIGILRELAKEQELPEYLVDSTIASEDTVEGLGIDSIGGVALIDRLEAEAGVHLPDDFLGYDDSVGNIAKRMNSLN
jgi:acyl carrier protein